MMARHFISNGPPFAAGTAAGGTLILFGGDLSSITANLADGRISSRPFRTGRGKGNVIPRGLSPVHQLKLIPSFFGFRGSKHSLNCAVEPLPVIHKFRSPLSPLCRKQIGTARRQGIGKVTQGNGVANV